ncbi:hypothetical protein G3N56_14810 [Desulfovibrio sulfodismutans]|uniref:Uncharacterized protein n=1 Tax=Desulfolutivibrio sulfodismutans TaxID=63561 RepID=A0A7K3NQC1_9BACT|nr:hypothetical protein [Desulfolutivibrio sulfodismutans]NDY58003.1 hypothetical protein [Desulfolutivibrio sulfodismutans]QLA13606.1 hypothetical protein GD606_15705 [Desulfolutivibrio sulfodismutans DSM 3696]
MVVISAGIVWFLFLLMAVILGLVRDRVLAPRLGDARVRRLMTVVLCLLIFLSTGIMVQYWNEATVWTAFAVGVSWTAATFVFECAMGRVAMKLSWDEILADYNVCQGRLWPLVLVSTLTAPVVCWSTVM